MNKPLQILLCKMLFCSLCIATPRPQDQGISSPHYIPNDRFAYLGTSTALMIVGLFGGAGVLSLMPRSITNWDPAEAKNLGSNYVRNITRGPIVDPDNLSLNLIGHPYSGALYYLQSRRSGFNWAFSALYSALCSTFLWEYGIEGFAETPSWQDLVITPALGSLVGELFYLGINAIQRNDSKILDSRFLGGLALLLLDPIGFIMQDLRLGEALGIKNKIQSFYLPRKDGVALVASYRW